MWASVGGQYFSSYLWDTYDKECEAVFRRLLLWSPKTAINHLAPLELDKLYPQTPLERHLNLHWWPQLLIFYWCEEVAKMSARLCRAVC
jgi:hypothetical protein